MSSHVVLEHTNGDKCIWIDGLRGEPGYWFKPYDVGGEGIECPHPHPFCDGSAHG